VFDTAVALVARGERGETLIWMSCKLLIRGGAGRDFALQRHQRFGTECSNTIGAVNHLGTSPWPQPVITATILEAAAGVHGVNTEAGVLPCQMFERLREHGWQAAWWPCGFPQPSQRPALTAKLSQCTPTGDCNMLRSIKVAFIVQSSSSTGIAYRSPGLACLSVDVRCGWV